MSRVFGAPRPAARGDPVPPPAVVHAAPQPDDGDRRPVVRAPACATPADGRLYIQNVVSTFELVPRGGFVSHRLCRGARPDKLDLCQLIARLATHGAGAGDFNQQLFAACKIRLTGLFFSTYKAVVTGARNELSSLFAAHKYINLLRRASYDVALRKFEVQNIVGSVNFGRKIDLSKLSSHNNFAAVFHPSLFPGCIYRLAAPRTVFIIYESGRIVITGAKTRGDINTAHAVCTALVQPFFTDSSDLHSTMRAKDARAAHALSQTRVGQRDEPAPSMPPLSLQDLLGDKAAMPAILAERMRQSEVARGAVAVPAEAEGGEEEGEDDGASDDEEGDETQSRKRRRDDVYTRVADRLKRARR